MKELLEKLNKINQEGVQAQHDTTTAVIYQSKQLQNLERTSEESGKYTRITSLLASQQVNKIEQLNNTVLAGLTADQKNLLDQQRKQKVEEQKRIFAQGLSGRAATNESRRIQGKLHDDSMKARLASMRLLKKSVGIAVTQFNIKRLEIADALRKYNARVRTEKKQEVRDGLLLSNVLAIRNHFEGAVTAEMAQAEIRAVESLIKQVAMSEAAGFDRFVWRKELALKEIAERFSREARERLETKKRDQRRESIDNKNRREAKINAEEAAQEQRNQTKKLLGAVGGSGGTAGPPPLPNSLLGGSGGGLGNKIVDAIVDVITTGILTKLGFKSYAEYLKSRVPPTKPKTSATGTTPKPAAAAAGQAQNNAQNKAQNNAQNKAQNKARTPGAGGRGVGGPLLFLTALLNIPATLKSSRKEIEEQEKIRKKNEAPSLDFLDKFSIFGEEFGINFFGNTADGVKELILGERKELGERFEREYPPDASNTRFGTLMSKETEDKIRNFSTPDFLRQRGKEVEALPLLIPLIPIAIEKGLKEFFTPKKPGGMGLPGLNTDMGGYPRFSYNQSLTGDELLKLSEESSAGNTIIYNTYNNDNSQVTQNSSQINNTTGARAPFLTGSVRGIG